MLNTEQINEAIAQVQSHVRAKIENNDWDLVSVRGVLYTLGYDGDQADYVIRAMYNRGFTHCIDSMFRTKDGDYVPNQATYWSPDQLESRLRSLY